MLGFTSSRSLGAVHMRHRQITLVERPKGKLKAEHFREEEAETPTTGEGEALVRLRYLSIDAANRAWMQGATYRSAVEAGSVMAGGGVAEIVESRADGFSPGDLVFADTGWREYAALPARQMTKLRPVEPMSHLLSVYGVAGLTAYFGLLRVGDPQPGETVVVSAAAGSVGVFVGQIAKIRGCRAIGIAGGAEKCAWLTEELGFDAAIDYRADDGWPDALHAAAPGGIDVYFDNVGGDILETCLFQMNQKGRIVCCGAVSQYDGAPPAHGPRGIPGLLVVRRIAMKGFIVVDYYRERESALAELEAWMNDGKLKAPEDIVEGLENAPAALIGLLNGDNRGKRIVRIVSSEW